MASEAPVTPRRIRKVHQSNLKVNGHPGNTYREHKTLNQHGTVDDYFGPVETLRTERSFHNAGAMNNSAQNSIKPESLSTDSNADHPSIIVPGITLLPSPSGSWSTVSSPGSDHGVWDSPEKPSLRPTQQIGVGAVTPLTPPTAYELPSDDTPSRKPSGPFIIPNVKSPNILDQLASRIPDQDNKEDIHKCQHEDEDSFRPKKLFRGFTDSLKAISEDTTNTAAQLNYKLQPSYKFSSDTTASVSSRTRSNIKRNNDFHDKDVKATIKADSEVVDIKVEVSSRAPTRLKGLYGDLEHILPSEIHTRLQDKAYRCVASLVKDPSKRCTYSSAAGKPADFRMLLISISTCSRDNDYASLLNHVKKLMDSILCGSHKTSGQVRISRVKARVPDLLSGPSDMLSTLNTWVEAITVPKLLPETEKTARHTPQASTDLMTATSSNLQIKSTTPSTTITTSFVTTVKPPTSNIMVPHQAGWSKGLSRFEATFSKIKEPLNATDKKEGYIYIFWDKENFGMVKIGYTRDLEARLKKWITQCKRPYTYHRPSDGGEVIKIPHVSRIERLIHLELKECRKRHLCEGCGKKHGEWFEVKEPQAVRVVRKWQQWILQKPYAYDPTSGEWRIRPEMMHTLAEVCKPVLEDVVQIKVGPKKDGMRRKSTRKSVPPTR